MGLDGVFADKEISAISRLLRPLAISPKISSSRGVMPSSACLFLFKVKNCGAGTSLKMTVPSVGGLKRV
jgi:hypothetical protein